MLFNDPNLKRILELSSNGSMGVWEYSVFGANGQRVHMRDHMRECEIEDCEFVGEKCGKKMQTYQQKIDTTAVQRMGYKKT